MILYDIIYSILILNYESLLNFKVWEYIIDNNLIKKFENNGTEKVWNKRMILYRNH